MAAAVHPDVRLRPKKCKQCDSKGYTVENGITRPVVKIKCKGCNGTGRDSADRERMKRAGIELR